MAGWLLNVGLLRWAKRRLGHKDWGQLADQLWLGLASHLPSSLTVVKIHCMWLMVVLSWWLLLCKVSKKKGEMENMERLDTQESDGASYEVLWPPS